MWKPQFIEWITKQEMAATLYIHKGVISLNKLENLPQNFMQYYIFIRGSHSLSPVEHIPVGSRLLIDLDCLIPLKKGLDHLVFYQKAL